MILTSLHIIGFGRLADLRLTFSRGLNVVFGPNESGKSTLANAIVATLYGAERKKEAWRPWRGGPFATTLVYELGDGQQIEVQRDFERDSKGLHVYDRSGNEISAQVAGAKLVPGEAHLGVPLEVFLNAACVKQQSIAIDDGKFAAPIAASLARALDGGPREDAALGAIARLEDALRNHVGTERARKNTPLRTLRERAVEQRASADEARARLGALADVRERRDRAAHECDRLTAAAADVERRVRAARAGAIAKRLENLHAFRAELAELSADHAAYDDVDDFPVERAGEIEEAFFAWQSAQQRADAAEADAAVVAPSAAERDEREQLQRDAGSIDDATYESLAAANGRAALARAAAVAAQREAASARKAQGDRGAANLVIAVTIATLCVAIGFAIAHSWTWTAVAAALALAGLAAAYSQARERAGHERDALAKQRAADEALATETVAAGALSSVLGRLGIETFEELSARRARLAELRARVRDAERSTERALDARLAAQAAAARFDRAAATVPTPLSGDRAARRAAIRALAARRRERDGIGAHLHALEMRRSTILGSDDEYALEMELAELRRDGVEAIDGDASATLRGVENERTAIAEQLRAARDTFARLCGELNGLDSHVTDVAELDEQVARTDAAIARIERFERAVGLAKSTLEKRTREAHQAFARRLEDYAAATLSAITAGRYGEIFVDPATLTIRVRVPETRAIVDLDAVSAGTRDQTYLVVRFAMARMFAEGIETPPLLLDDPFAYWDAARIERCLPILEHGARDAQAILFTSSRELADAAERRGALRHDLPEPALAAPEVFERL